MAEGARHQVRVTVDSLSAAVREGALTILDRESETHGSCREHRCWPMSKSSNIKEFGASMAGIKLRDADAGQAGRSNHLFF